MYLQDEFRDNMIRQWCKSFELRNHKGSGSVKTNFLLEALNPKAPSTSVIDNMLEGVSSLFSSIFYPQPANTAANTSATTTTLTTTTMTTTTGSTGVISATHPATQTPSTASLAQVVVIEPQAAAVATAPLPKFPPVPTTPLVHVEPTAIGAQQTWTTQEEQKAAAGREVESEKQVG